MYSSARALRAASPAPSGAGSNGWSARDRNGASGPFPSAAFGTFFSAIAPVLVGPSRPAILLAPGSTPPAGPPWQASRQSNSRDPFRRRGRPAGLSPGRWIGPGILLWMVKDGRPASEGESAKLRPTLVVHLGHL